MTYRLCIIIWIRSGSIIWFKFHSVIFIILRGLIFRIMFCLIILILSDYSPQIWVYPPQILHLTQHFSPSSDRCSPSLFHRKHRTNPLLVAQILILHVLLFEWCSGLPNNRLGLAIKEV